MTAVRLVLSLTALATALANAGCLIDETVFADCSTTGSLGCVGDVKVGLAHVCRVAASGDTRCWGWNDFGQATPPATLFRQVTAGGYHSCGLTENNDVDCWGAGTSLATCNVTLQDVDDPQCGQAASKVGPFVSVSAGLAHTCAVREDGPVECWGAGRTYDEVGCTTNDLAACGQGPAVVDGTFAQVVAGLTHTCALARNGLVTCWGYDGTASLTNARPGEVFTQLVAGALFTCGLKPDGHADCWGNQPTITDTRFTPSWVPTKTFVRLAASSTAPTVCGIEANGTIACWGLGAGTVNCAGAVFECAQAIPPEGSYLRVSVGQTNACAIDQDGAVRCWGAGGRDAVGLCHPNAGTSSAYQCGQSTPPTDI